MNYISLTIKPTNACNMRCKHCYHAEEGFENNVLSLEMAKRFVELGAKEYSKVNILIHGGEPTLCGVPYIEQFIEYQNVLSEKYGTIFSNTIQTNGLLLNTEWMRLFSKYRINLGISFDGPHNDMLREKTNIVYENIRELQKRNIKFAILCVETKKTISNIIDTYEWFKEKGLSYKILPIFKYGNAKTESELLLEPKLYAEKMILLYKYWLMDTQCMIRVNTLEELLRLFRTDFKIKFSDSCMKHRLAINPDESIYPCGRPYDSRFKLGELNNVCSLKNLFDTYGYRELLDIYEKRIVNCKKGCIYFDVCRGGCISNSIIDGSLTEVDGISCLNSKFLFDRLIKINSSLTIEKILNPRAIQVYSYN